MLENFELCGCHRFSCLKVEFARLRGLVLSNLQSYFEGGDDLFTISSPHLCSLVISSRIHTRSFLLENVLSLAIAGSVMILPAMNLKSIATCYSILWSNFTMIQNLDLRLGAFRLGVSLLTNTKFTVNHDFTKLEMRGRITRTSKGTLQNYFPKSWTAHLRSLRASIQWDSLEFFLNLFF